MNGEHPFVGFRRQSANGGTAVKPKTAIRMGVPFRVPMMGPATWLLGTAGFAKTGPGEKAARQGLILAVARRRCPSRVSQESEQGA